MIVDDIVGSGGTIEAVGRAIRGAGGNPVSACVVGYLPGLGGIERLANCGIPVFAICALEKRHQIKEF